MPLLPPKSERNKLGLDCGLVPDPISAGLGRITPRIPQKIQPQYWVGPLQSLRAPRCDIPNAASYFRLLAVFNWLCLTGRVPQFPIHLSKAAIEAEVALQGLPADNRN
jgi:hypothetical protein